MQIYDIFMKSGITLKEDSGIRLDVEIYKPINADSDEFGVYISHDGSSGIKREHITTSEEFGNCIKDYV